MRCIKIVNRKERKSDDDHYFQTSLNIMSCNLFKLSEEKKYITLSITLEFTSLIYFDIKFVYSYHIKTFDEYVVVAVHFAYNLNG